MYLGLFTLSTTSVYCSLCYKKYDICNSLIVLPVNFMNNISTAYLLAGQLYKSFKFQFTIFYI